ncbi:MAG: PQQ-binding-like beta-propeller repeat protein, partial [Pirellulales bacterium]
VNVGYTAGPRASVTIDEVRAFSLGSMGHLLALDAASGKPLWSKDLNTEYKIRMPIWGIAASPLVDGNLVIVQIGGEGACLVAFDKKTGKEAWKALQDNASYSAPIMIQQAGRAVMVCWTGESVVGINAQTGEVYWQHPFKPAKMVINIATPVLEKNRLFFTSFYDGSLMLSLKPDELAVEELWRRSGRDERNTDSLHSIISTPYLEGDHVYGIDSYGEFRCLDALSGDRVWESLEPTPKARWSTVHMVKNGPRMWMFNERGELLIAKLSPQGFQEISRAKLIKPTRVQLSQRAGVCWSHPAFANRHVFARNDEELVAASLAKGEN